jgi:hypothetical protein
MCCWQHRAVGWREQLHRVVRTWKVGRLCWSVRCNNSRLLRSRGLGCRDKVWRGVLLERVWCLELFALRAWPLLQCPRGHVVRDVCAHACGILFGRWRQLVESVRRRLLVGAYRRGLLHLPAGVVQQRRGLGDVHTRSTGVFCGRQRRKQQRAMPDSPVCGRRGGNLMCSLRAGQLHAQRGLQCMHSCARGVRSASKQHLDGGVPGWHVPAAVKRHGVSAVPNGDICIGCRKCCLCGGPRGDHPNAECVLDGCVCARVLHARVWRDRLSGMQLGYRVIYSGRAGSRELRAMPPGHVQQRGWRSCVRTMPDTNFLYRHWGKHERGVRCLPTRFGGSAGGGAGRICVRSVPTALIFGVPKLADVHSPAAVPRGVGAAGVGGNVCGCRVYSVRRGHILNYDIARAVRPLPAVHRLAGRSDAVYLSCGHVHIAAVLPPVPSGAVQRRRVPLRRRACG